MKDKLYYYLGGVIGLSIVCVFFYCIAYLIFMMLERVLPDQTYFFLKLFNENIFVFLALFILLELAGRMLKLQKARHRTHLNKLAEIEWIMQYGDEGRIR